MEENTKNEAWQNERLKQLEARVKVLEQRLGEPEGHDTRTRAERKVDAVLAVLRNFGVTAESWLPKENR